MMSNVELEMWAKLDAAKAEEAAIEEAIRPLKEQREQACRERQQANMKANKLTEEIDAIRFPRMAEVRKEIAMYSRALNGKKRPETKAEE